MTETNKSNGGAGESIGGRKPLGLGLIGCGSFGRFCLENYSRMDAVMPRAVADVRGQLAEEFGREFSVQSFDDQADLIAMEQVDIVHIATPPSSHYDLVLQAVQAGKHVLCEKPLAMNLAQADEMLAASRASGSVLVVNFILRYNAVTQAVKAVIDSGVMGQVLCGRLTNCAGDSSLAPEHWFWDKKLSGGIFIEHGVHFFDLYRHWLGGAEVIFAHTETRPGTSQEDRVMCTLRHDNGAVVSHYHGFDQPSLIDRTCHRLVCEMGDIRVDGWIPLAASIEALVDDRGGERLIECCPGADVEVLQTYTGQERQVTGRGKTRQVTKKIRMHFCPETDKQKIYSASACSLLADQIAYIRDPNHTRVVTETNGRDALAWAQKAVELAGK
jgi:predicted dehydrogenase